MVLYSPVLSGVAAETGRFGLAGSFIDGNSPFLCKFVAKGASFVVAGRPFCLRSGIVDQHL